MLCCEARAYLLVRLHDKSPFFTSWKTRMRMNLDQVANGHFVLGETFFASSIIAKWPLTIRVTPTKVCQQCKAAVPVRRKTCECCNFVFRKAECNLREKAV